MNLHESKRIILTRCPNGWTAKKEAGDIGTDGSFVFESTESLARHLVFLLGKSGWEVAPPRDKSGKFAKAALEFEV